MLTTKNWRTLPVRPAQALFLAAVLAGCTPSGPRALLKGERLLREGKYSQAIPRLQQATQLLPANAQAWNHLGLAYHHSGQFSAALQAYAQARRCDPNLRSVRYNLGCLLLQDNQPQAAAAELTAFTLLQPEAADGWLKLGTAQLHGRQLDAAERSFQTALRLQPDSAEAWNGLGIIQTHRKRAREALNCFSTARQKHPHYAPALLNLAIVEQYHLNNRSHALQAYEEYLALKPTPQDANAVQDLVRQLRAELAPPVHREITNAVAASPPSLPAAGSNLTAAPHPGAPVPSHAVSNGVASAAPAPVATNHVRSISTGLVASIEPAPRTKSVEAARHTDTPARKEESVAATPTKPPATVPAATQPPAPQVVRLADEPPPRLAQDSTPQSTSPAPRASSAPRAAAPDQVEQARTLLARKPDDVPAEVPPAQKRRVIDRLNPTTWFRGKRHPATGPTPMEPIADTRTDPGLESGSATAQRTAELTAPTVARSSGRRYTYQLPAKPAPGDRIAAQRVFAQAVQAHRDGRLSEAIENYRQATKLDPGFYEAHYNLGLAAYELKDEALSLSAYETALSLNPTSDNARYNFALALEQGAYFQDAANELQKVIEQHPDETRAHLSLANLYADRLSRPDLARVHYRRVLELAPQHPQAGAIRYWLAANP